PSRDAMVEQPPRLVRSCLGRREMDGHVSRPQDVDPGQIPWWLGDVDVHGDTGAGQSACDSDRVPLRSSEFAEKSVTIASRFNGLRRSVERSGATSEGDRVEHDVSATPVPADLEPSRLQVPGVSGFEAGVNDSE